MLIKFNRKIKILCLILIFVIFVYFYYFYRSHRKSQIRKIKQSIDLSDPLHFDNLIDTSDLDHQKIHFSKMKDNRLRSMREASQANELGNLQMFIVPQLSCPTMVRLGRLGDGGKFICNPWRVRENCTVFSLGVAGDVSFEMDLFTTTSNRCKIYCIDSGLQSENLFLPFNGFFYQTSIAGGTNKDKSQTSIWDLMELFDHKRLEIMKIDIEMTEFEALPAFFERSNITETYTNVCQLLIEFHFWIGNLLSKLESWLSMFEELEKRGFRMFSKEANMYCLGCYEFSYLHLTCFEQYGISKWAVVTTYFV